MSRGVGGKGKGAAVLWRGMVIGIRWAREVAKALASPVLRPLGWDAASAVVPRPPTNLLAVPEFPDATNWDSHDSDDLLAAHLTTVVLYASLAWCCHVFYHEIHVSIRHIAVRDEIVDTRRWHRVEVTA